MIKPFTHRLKRKSYQLQTAEVPHDRNFLTKRAWLASFRAVACDRQQLTVGMKKLRLAFSRHFSAQNQGGSLSWNFHLI